MVRAFAGICRRRGTLADSSEKPRLPLPVGCRDEEAGDPLDQRHRGHQTVHGSIMVIEGSSDRNDEGSVWQENMTGRIDPFTTLSTNVRFEGNQPRIQ